MDQDTSSTMSPTAIHLCGKSWTAYIGVFISALILFFGALPLAYQYVGELAAGAVMLVAVLYVGYTVLSIRSVQLYYDDVGVWAYGGILPWTKGVMGVKWRDMDEATFGQGFWSWLFKSYSIRIGHRFTKSSEIYMTSMSHGKEAAGILNNELQTLIRSRSIV